MNRVIIVEDDPHFAEVLRTTFSDSPDFTVDAVYASTSNLLNVVPITMQQAQKFMPDLLVVDALAFNKNAAPNEASPDGITMSIFLRRSGLFFSSLVITSLDLRVVGERFGEELGPGWEFLQKRSTLTGADILEASRRSIASLRSR